MGSSSKDGQDESTDIVPGVRSGRDDSLEGRGSDSGNRRAGVWGAIRSLGVTGGVTFLAYHGKIDGTTALVALTSLAVPELAVRLIDIFRKR